MVLAQALNPAREISLSDNISKGCFAFVPNVDISLAHTDKALYDLFELDDDDIEEIESKMKPMTQSGDSDD